MGKKDIGLTEDTVKKLVEAIMGCGNVREIILYGSRSIGTFRNFSDIDIALKGDGLTREDLYPILERIEDLYLPYEIDLSIFSRLDYPPLIEDIDRTGLDLVAWLSA